MPGYQTRITTLGIGAIQFHIRSLVDLQQFADPDAHAQRAGISSAQWSLFGQVWPCGRLLAEQMAVHDIVGKRILELGCGLGLASLVLHQRGADVVASDHHPLAEVFLAYNAALNALPAVPFRTVDWDHPNTSLGHFDMIIGSDVLYERGHARHLTALLSRHALPVSEVLIADPGRGNSAPFSRGMGELGFSVIETRHQLSSDESPPFRSRLLHCRRKAAPHSGGNA